MQITKLGLALILLVALALAARLTTAGNRASSFPPATQSATAP